MAEVRLGDRLVGDGHPCMVIAEIGINHNGDVELAKKLIDVAYVAGCEAVKFQKRTIDVVYTPEELAKPRESPFGETNGDLKRGWSSARRSMSRSTSTAAANGHALVGFLLGRGLGGLHRASSIRPATRSPRPASPTTSCCATPRQGPPIVLSTGMSTLEQIDHAVEVLGTKDLVLLHCCSAYPAQLRGAEPACDPDAARAVRRAGGLLRPRDGFAFFGGRGGLGACIVERHITLDRAMWGSDQAASLEPNGIMRLVRDIRLVEKPWATAPTDLAER